VIFKLFRTFLRPTVWITAERGFSELFFLALFAVQAPILGPSAFGLVAAVMVFVGFWEMVPGRAITEALVSIRDIDSLHFSTATTASALLCAGIGALVVAFSIPLSTAFGDSQFAPVMCTMAVIPFIQAFSTAPTAAAHREMQFQSIALRTIVSIVAGGAVGLGLALYGAGVWALVWQALVQRVVAVVVIWLAVPLRLQFQFSRRHFRELAMFALPVTLARGMGWVSSALPRLILGLFLGPAELGLYSLASRLTFILEQVSIVPKTQVARVDLRRFTSDSEGLARAVRHVFMQISVLTLPICMGGAAVVPTLFHAWLDPRWYGAVVPAQLLLLSLIPNITFYVGSAVLLAMNRQHWEAGVATIQSVGTLVAVAGASPFGLVPTTAATAAVLLAMAPLPILAMRRKCNLSLRDILVPQVPAFVAAGAMGVAVSLLRIRLEASNSSATLLLILMATGALLYLLLLAVTMPRRTAFMLRHLSVRARAAVARVMS
jgi:O-antigen/teichoic acid export membrane protein